MNRRSFIAALVATAVLDPERLLWVPGQKTIFVPPPSVSRIYYVSEMEFGLTRVRWTLKRVILEMGGRSVAYSQVGLSIGEPEGLAYPPNTLTH